MSELVKIASWKGRPRASVVFVHGLHGHFFRTWRRASVEGSFWPVWLAGDVSGLAVYSLAYEAPVSNWLGTSMPLQDRAANIFETLLTEPGLRTGPVIFVCHSLGGLVIKKLLLNLQLQAERRPEAADLLDRVQGVVFAATPHTGSAHATWIDRLRFLAWPSSLTRSLVANDPGLREINVAYRGLADDRRSRLRHQIFYETRASSAGTIVDEASSDPGLPGDPPVPIDADHRSIVRPTSRSSLLYARVRQFVELVPAAAEDVGEVELAPLPEISSDRSFNPIPKLIRVGALALVALIAFKGVQALMVQQPLRDQLAEQIRQNKEQARQMAEQNRQSERKDELYAKFLATMDESRSTPAPPGAQQALRTALIAFDKGAKVDSRLAQALELLNAGKLSEAEVLLIAVTEDEVKTTADANKKAAAYRNLASIVAISSPGRARDYYAQAAQLDPDNFEGICMNGFYQLEAGNPDVARAAFERVVSKAGANDNLWMYAAQIGLGDILMSRSNLVGALKSYKSAFVAANKLARSDPGNADWQGYVSVSLERIGDVQEAHGDLPAALGNYQDALINSEKLAKLNPGSPNSQYSLWGSLNKMGDLQLKQGDLAGATGQYSSAFAIAEAFYKSDPRPVSWQRNVSDSYERTGNLQVLQGDLSGALLSYGKSLEIRERLEKTDSGNVVWQRELSVSLNKIGDVQLKQGDLSDALRSYSDAFDRRERLTKSNPGDALWQHDLSVSFSKIGDVLLVKKDLEGALKRYSDSVATLEKLAKSDPDNTNWQQALSISINQIGDVWFHQPDLPRALGYYMQGLAIAEELAKSDPSNAGWQRQLASALSRLAAVQERQNDKAKAIESLRKIRDIMLRLTERAPGNVLWKQDLAWCDAKIAQLSR